MPAIPENNNWESVELVYAPPGAIEPNNTDTEAVGSSNHANVFNRRLQSVVNRTAWLRNLLTVGRIKQLLDLSNTANKLLSFDSGGNLIATDFSMSVGTVRLSVLQAANNPFQDTEGFWWFVPDGSALTPSVARYERLYKAVWSSMQPSQITGGKGLSADSDWNAGKNILYPDCRDYYVQMRSVTRPINQLFGSRQISLSPENYKHSHNLSVRGVAPVVINSQNTFNFLASAGYGLIHYSEAGAAPGQPPNPTNIKGNRSATGDSLGAIWENTNNNAVPVDYSPPGISLEVLIYLGFRG